MTDSRGEISKLTGTKQESLREIIGRFLQDRPKKDTNSEVCMYPLYQNICHVNVSSSPEALFSRDSNRKTFASGRVCEVQRNELS